MRRNLNENNRTGIRVKHFQSRKTQDQRCQDKDSINSFINQSLLSKSPSIFGSSRTPQKQRRKIFQGRSKSPKPSNHSQQRSKEQDNPLQPLLPTAEEIQIIYTHKQGEPVRLPDPLNIFQNQNDAKEILAQMVSPMEYRTTHIEYSSELFVNNSFCQQGYMKSVEPPTQIGSLQQYLRQPQHIREQLLEKITPNRQILMEQNMLPNRPVLVGIQQTMQQEYYRQRIPSHYDKCKIQEQNEMRNRQAHNDILKRQHQCEILNMRQEIARLTDLLQEKTVRQKLFEQELNDIAVRRNNQLQRKDAEISTHIIRIQELSTQLFSTQRELETARYELNRVKQEKTIGLKNLAMQNCSFSTKIVDKKPTVTWQVIDKSINPINQSTQESYLSPLSVDTSRAYGNSRTHLF